MSLLSVIVSKIFTVEICMTLTFKMGQRSNVNARRNPIHDFLLHGNRNVFLICHHFQDIHCPNILDFDLELNTVPRSNVDLSMPFNIPYITSHIMAIISCTISVIACKIITNDLPTRRRFEILTFNEKVKQM